ncbi:peptide antibiotic transporter SbmA [Lentilitoribacter sp. Alg239-R112]|uniref:peptide antibiotic transporter SbmA n=1 Tax=Lentilitoribacter sp. Alg239-R112 TaxID=2305987 RepID=UPI0013A6BCF6|nr:peptide antibiotic transporter SbmA [Lentilitoribacter sp. Alg239-R112]
MFRSFFPDPKLFFFSAIIWTVIAIGIWFGFVETYQPFLDTLAGYAQQAVEGERPPFLTADKLLIYIYMALAGFGFAVVWMFLDKNTWSRWSVLGSTIIILVTYYNVQLSVFLNDWYGGFNDLLQKALSEKNSVTLEEFYSQLMTVAPILLVNITVLVLLDFFVSHYVFRWRTAMNNYFMDHWPKLRHIEGAAQRVQEDTQRFARIVEGLGVAFVRSMMTLIAFLPLLYTLSQNITEIPFIGKVDGSMVYVAIMSALLGTALLAIVGIKLPGLEFNNQKVEAAYRKELVYGEDRADRAQPATVKELYEGVRKNYYRLYFNYLYFNVARFGYLNVSSFIPLVALAPTVVSGTITLGIFAQINNAFDKVEESFKFFANVWTTIIDLMSIYKRLISFESIIYQDEETATDEAPQNA